VLLASVLSTTTSKDLTEISEQTQLTSAELASSVSCDSAADFLVQVLGSDPDKKTER